MENTLRIRVRIGDSEVEASYPITERVTSDVTTPETVIKVVKEIVEAIKKEKA